MWGAGGGGGGGNNREAWWQESCPWGQKEGVEVSFCSVGKRLQKGLKLRLPNRQLQVEGDQRDRVPGTPSHEEEWRSLHILGLLLCRHQEVIKGESSRADRRLLWARPTETGDCPATPQKLESLSERGARKANSRLVDTQGV